MKLPVQVSLEAVRRRTFAVAVDWPGWTRGGRDEKEALDALLRAAPRYARVTTSAGVPFTTPDDASGFVVVDRLPGNSGTEFGVPSVELPEDSGPLDEAELERHVAILQATWSAFEAAAERHAGDELRTGPRGGGRDLPKIIAHVEESDRAYLVQLGVRPPKGPAGPAPMTDIHAATLAALRARAAGRPIENPNKVSRPWMPRWYARRVAWHWLDHAWEIEDRAMAPG
jgi:hypothetical protein